jgi:hypothetical protein
VSYSWSAEESVRRRREGAVSDVLAGMSDIGAAAAWGVQVDDLRRWVADARADERDES